MEELADLLIVSQVEVSGEADEIRVESAAGVKCPRLWARLPARPTPRACAPGVPPWWPSCPSSEIHFQP